MPTDHPTEITDLLVAWRQGDERALADLMKRTYQALKGIAARLLEHEHPSHTLQTTALVHEAFVRLARLNEVPWKDRAHFFALSARLMRRILVDHARRSRSEKRGGDMLTMSFDKLPQGTAAPAHDLLRVDSVLRELANHDPEKARIVELRFFGGLSGAQIAEVTGLSTATVARRWRSARAWLINQLNTA